MTTYRFELLWCFLSRNCVVMPFVTFWNKPGWDCENADLMESIIIMCILCHKNVTNVTRLSAIHSSNCINHNVRVGHQTGTNNGSVTRSHLFIISNKFKRHLPFNERSYRTKWLLTCPHLPPNCIVNNIRFGQNQYALPKSIHKWYMAMQALCRKRKCENKLIKTMITL